jgi:hypothetical protein
VQPERPPTDPEVERRWALVRDRYGDRLTAEELAQLRQVVEGLVGAVQEVRRVPLTNADAPLDGFAPLRRTS